VVCCPICLIASPSGQISDESSSSPSPSETNPDADKPLFVKTPCGHTFCKECIERVLLKPRDGNIPTRAPCPMCRKTINLFDLLVHDTPTDDDDDGHSLVYDAEGMHNMSSWSIANSKFQQRSMIPIPNANAILKRMINENGAIQGFGINFSFHEPTPSMNLDKPLKMAFDCDWTEVVCKNNNNNDDDSDGSMLPLDSITFDRSYFHEASMTFHGKVHFANPVCSSSSVSHGDYFYEELDCLLHFSGSGRYVRKGELRWKLATSTPNEAYPFPLDGTWEVQYSHGTSMVLHVQKHLFAVDGLKYRIVIDEHHRPRFVWPGTLVGENVEQTSDQQIHPGTCGPAVGETLHWETTSIEYERIIWKRLSTNLDNCWKSFNILAGNFVYQKCNQLPGTDQPSVPSYHNTSLWGNTFCQLFTVGLASYHFLEPDSDGNYQAYISYESPKTEAWPSLDNGDRVPARVPFRNITFEPETRTFKGDICWEEDYGTAWMGESKWSYEIVFDPTFVFIESGTVGRSMGESHMFGVDLIYINAAIETSLRTSLASQSTGEYFDVVREWRDSNASTGTLQMLGQVAMAVMGDRESMIDFNI